MNTTRVELRWALVGLLAVGAVGLLLPWGSEPFTARTVNTISSPIGGRSVLAAMGAGGVVAALTGSSIPERIGLWLVGAASILGTMYAVTMTFGDTFAIGHVVTGLAAMAATALVLAEMGRARIVPDVATPSARLAGYLLAGGGAMSVLGALVPIIDLPGASAAIGEAAWWPSGLLALAASFAGLSVARRMGDEATQWRTILRGSVLLVGAASYHSVILDASQGIGFSLQIFSIGAYLPIVAACLAVSVAIIARSHVVDESPGVDVLSVTFHGTSGLGGHGAEAIDR